VKREANSEFPQWGYVPYKDQIENYFKTIKKLSGEGFNPKANFPPNIVSDADIAKAFRLSSKSFKTTNLNLHPKMKKDLFRFYWKMFGTNQVTNNKLMIWFMKCYIVQKKGEKVNWAKAIASTAQEKARKEEANLMKNGFAIFSGKRGGEGSKNFNHKFYKFE
jgi:hypothetical protein